MTSSSYSSPETDGLQIITSGSLDSNFYLAAYDLDANGAKIPKSEGGHKLTYLKVVGKQTTFDGHRTLVDTYSGYVYDALLAMNIPRTHHRDESSRLPQNNQVTPAAFATSDKNGNLILGTEQVLEESTGTSDSTVVGGFSSSGLVVTTRTCSAAVTFVSRAGVSQEEAWAMQSVYVVTINATHVTTTTTFTGDRLILRGMVAGESTVCIAYSLEHFPVPSTTWLQNSREGLRPIEYRGNQCPLESIIYYHHHKRHL